MPVNAGFLQEVLYGAMRVLCRACLIFIALLQRQGNDEGAPFSRRTPGGNCPIVALDYFPADGQPHS